MAVARERPKQALRLGWARAGATGGVLGGGVTALLFQPLIRELAGIQPGDLAMVWPLIDATFAGLGALIGASLGVLPWRAARSRQGGSDFPASDPSLGEAIGVLAGCAAAAAVAPCAGGAAGWIASGAAAGATAGAVTEALAGLLGDRRSRSHESRAALPLARLTRLARRHRSQPIAPEVARCLRH